jgi:hypothetical protein
LDLDESLRIRKEAQTICEPYRIQVVKVDPLPTAAGEGFAVTIWLPRHLSLDGPEVTAVRDRTEAIRGVTKVWILLAPDAG